MVNEPLVFEPLKFYTVYNSYMVQVVRKKLRFWYIWLLLIGTPEQLIGVGKFRILGGGGGGKGGQNRSRRMTS